MEASQWTGKGVPTCLQHTHSLWDMGSGVGLLPHCILLRRKREEIQINRGSTETTHMAQGGRDRLLPASVPQ